jgi:hypothetical protein
MPVMNKASISIEMEDFNMLITRTSLNGVNKINKEREGNRIDL